MVFFYAFPYCALVTFGVLKIRIKYNKIKNVYYKCIIKYKKKFIKRYVNSQTHTHTLLQIEHCLYTSNSFSIHVFIMYRVPNVSDVIKYLMISVQTKERKKIKYYIFYTNFPPCSPRFTQTYIFIHNLLLSSHTF